MVTLHVPDGPPNSVLNFESVFQAVAAEVPLFASFPALEI